MPLHPGPLRGGWIRAGAQNKRDSRTRESRLPCACLISQLRGKTPFRNVLRRYCLLPNKEGSQVRESSLLFYFWFSTLSAAWVRLSTTGKPEVSSMARL